MTALEAGTDGLGKGRREGRQDIVKMLQRFPNTYMVMVYNRNAIMNWLK
jgi:hypothetical protein